MAKTKAQSVKSTLPKKSDKQIADEVCARIALHYNAYTLAAARRLPYKDIIVLDKAIERERGSMYYTLMQIVTVPNTKEAKKNVKKLADYFKQMMRS